MRSPDCSPVRSELLRSLDSSQTLLQLRWLPKSGLSGSERNEMLQPGTLVKFCNKHHLVANHSVKDSDIGLVINAIAADPHHRVLYNVLINSYAVMAWDDELTKQDD